MPPSSTDPYRSRLFNFLNSQAVRLKDRLQRGFRQFKTVATLGVQVILYPLYLLVQASRMTRRQLQQNAQKIPSLLQSAPPTLASDQAVVKVLEAVAPHLIINEGQATLQLQHLLNPYQQQTQSPLTTIQKAPGANLLPAAATIQLQGIASLIPNRHLVLVGQDNHILDVLDFQVSEQLEKRIYLEIANYYYQKRLQAPIRPQVIDFLPVLAPAPVQVLAPLRLFWEIMRWEQHGAIATTINFFGEATLTPVPIEFPLTMPAEILSSLEAWWAKRQPLPASSQIITLTEDSTPLPGLIQTALSHFGASTLWKDKAQAWLTPFTSSLNAPENPFALQVLIAAAIEYFFVKKQGQLPTEPEISSPLVAPEEDSWLVWGDLYPEVVPLDPSPTSYSFKAPAPPPPVWVDDAVGDQQWLDAQAQPLGYVQHPLEKILQILDRLILWLEELGAKIYHWFTQQWQQRRRR